MKLTEEKNAILEKYMEGILAWNEKVNLTNITDPAEFRIKHNADSLMCVDFPEFLDAETVIDVGTGGGFPGIPLAVYAPEKQFTLLDSLNKRLKIIDELAGELGIKNITLVHGRAEEAAKALKTLGGSLVDIRETSMEEYGLDHRILVIKKVRNTPKAYPRKAGTPLKEPLK